MAVSLHDRVPSYLLGKFQLTATVTFTALFSVVYILLSMPFANNSWFRLDGPQSFSFTIVFFCAALLIVVLSRRLMYSFSGAQSFTFLHYLLWNLAEIIAVAVLYIFVSLEGVQYGIIDMPEMTLDKIITATMVQCIICLGVPYLISAMYFSIQDKNNTIRLMNYGSVVTDSEPSSHDVQKITLFDNEGVLKLSVSLSNLYFIESDDNYIKVWYRDAQGALRQYMLRCRLKTVEDSFSGSDLVRCHRKYIINISKVSVLSREKDGYQVDLGLEDIAPIPISKTYEETVLSIFNSR